MVEGNCRLSACCELDNCGENVQLNPINRILIIILVDKFQMDGKEIKVSHIKQSLHQSIVSLCARYQQSAGDLQSQPGVV